MTYDFCYDDEDIDLGDYSLSFFFRYQTGDIEIVFIHAYVTKNIRQTNP